MSTLIHSLLMLKAFNARLLYFYNIRNMVYNDDCKTGRVILALKLKTRNTVRVH